MVLSGFFKIIFNVFKLVFICSVITVYTQCFKVVDKTVLAFDQDYVTEY